MNTPLIPIQEHDGRTAVSLRDLHTFLEVKKDFTDWAKQMFEYGFTEGQDYIEINESPSQFKNPNFGEYGNLRPKAKRNWAISLDMAKELSMIQRTDKGKEARQYFIEVEKQKHSAPKGAKLLALAVVEAQKVIEESKAQIAVLVPKAEAWDSIVSSAGSWSYNDAAKVLCESGEIQIGEKRLVNRLVAWGYLYRDHKRRPHTYQRYLEQGLFVVKARTYQDQVTGEIRESSAPQVRITGKGLHLIRKRLLELTLQAVA